MAEVRWTPPNKAQVDAASALVEPIMAVATSERGVHAETAIAAAARLAGTFLFRSFDLPALDAPPGTPVLSEQANEQGPLLVDTLQFGLQAYDVPVDLAKLPDGVPEDHRPHLGVTETQERLEERVANICAAAKLSQVEAAHACALGAARLMKMAEGVLDPHAAFVVAAYGFVEGTKTQPIPAPRVVWKKPWYARWS